MFSKVQAVTAPAGYWGQATANHQFCEPHYASSPYFAEFWNGTPP